MIKLGSFFHTFHLGKVEAVFHLRCAYVPHLRANVYAPSSNGLSPYRGTVRSPSYIFCYTSSVHILCFCFNVEHFFPSTLLMIHILARQYLWVKGLQFIVLQNMQSGKKMTKCKLCDFLHHIISGLTVRMGFSSSLQGDSAHEALITRQDAELRLLENMKRCALHCLGQLWVNIMFRCITLRVKCDREYSIALNSVVLQVRFLHC